MMMQLKCLDYMTVRLCLRCNDKTLVMKYLYALLWYNDVNVLISHMRVILKGCSHEILIELMTLNIQGYLFSYDLNRVMSFKEWHFKKGL